MEHIELAGIHSGDSACVIPPVSISEENKATILKYTQAIAKELNVVGLMNMQYAIEKGKVYVIEANPRASRTVPLVSKVCNIQMAQAATSLMLGASLESLGLKHRVIPHYGVKEAVFPFSKFPEVDPVLGPEMRSTGEVLGLASSFGLAYFKSQEATYSELPVNSIKNKVLVSLSEKKEAAVPAIRAFVNLGFSIIGTEGTINWLAKYGIEGKVVQKINEGRPNVLDVILNREVALVINTPSGRRDSRADDASIRKASLKYQIPYLTTLAAVEAAAQGIRAARDSEGRVKSLQAYHSDIM
jgi:carbamoyl-phosphate synthase large subunit